ncbi:immune inhibitor A domain-containing protein [Hathewaya limosa]|uniref:Immune inhibitor A n=1 Tax=Hathewaya limosa TaxID=1536 RepID=A0ABU0JUK8_HATLI|nr:immune inhibitor A domain-containing protein [Hathewaya limosa]MDQ0480785.1 immune inhibitor A [Hathewaya limosa]
MISKKLTSIILSATIFLGLSGNCTLVHGVESAELKGALPTIEKQQYSKKKFTAKPLIILMDFPDYKHEDLDKKETWRINNFKGSECTPEFYKKLFFGKDYYKTSDGQKHITVNKFLQEESGGTYGFEGKVVGWYMADHEAKYYGSNEGGSDQERARKLVKEAIEKASKDIDLSEFDVEDKWDLDGDGNYDEPDGILDTVVVIHPGLGEEWGGGSLGENAIWPYRWGFNIFGQEMDKLNNEEKEALVKKNPIVTDKNGKKFRAEDFTVFEQDLPVDLFAHEYGHVLGLPDLYAFHGQDVPVENWSIMGGSYTGDPRGSQPVSYGAYCREYLQKDFEKRGRKANWQNSKELNLSDIDEKGMDIVLDQASLKGKNNDAIRINLPKRKGNRIVIPSEGKTCYFSGKGNHIENYMTTKESLDLTGKDSAELSFKTWYKIDPGFDFASVQVREKGKKEWTCVKGNITTDKVDKWIVDNDAESIKKRNPGHGITDSSKGKWVDAKFDLSAFKGKKIDLRFRFRTDGNTPEEGIYIDDIKVTADNKALLNDNAEGDTKFNFDGFVKSDGVEIYDHYYLVEWRNSGADTLSDKGLKTINIGRKGLEYDPGLIIWHIDEKYNGFKPDQQAGDHPGRMFAGVVDADQNPVTYRYEKSGRNGADNMNYQMHDAAFSLRPGSKINITGKSKDDVYHIEDNHNFMNPVFSDSQDYSAKYKKVCGLDLAKYGLNVFVTDESKDRSTAKIHIAKYNNGSNCTNQDASLIKSIEEDNGKLFIQTDNKYGDKVYAEFRGKDNKVKQLVLDYKDGKYVSDAAFLKENLDFKLSHVIFIDNEGNAKCVYNKGVHKIFGANLNIEQPNKVIIENGEDEFKQGTTPKVTVKFRDASNKSKRVRLLIGVYNDKNRIVGSSEVSGNLDSEGRVTLKAGVRLPKEDNLKLKVFVCDSNTFEHLTPIKVVNVK